MKRIVAKLLVVGVLAALTPVAAQQQTVTLNEAEPNDVKDRAQPIALTPGMTTIIKGRVSREDPGAFVDELQYRFGVSDAIEDWYVVETSGVAEFSYEITWPEDADVDAWVFTDVSRDVYFDGLTLHAHTATGANPERLTNRLFYTYSDRVDEIQGMLQPLPGTSRYYIAISNYDPADWSRPANYELKLTVPPGARARQGDNQFVRYDNNGHGRFTRVGPHDLEGRVNRMLVLERITPPAYPATLESVNLVQFDTSGPEQRQDLIVLVDPAGRGNPVNARQVLRRKVRTPIVEEASAVAYYLAESGIQVTSGDIYVGFELVEDDFELHLAFDIDKAGFRRTFISTNGGTTYRHLMIRSDEVELPLISNSGITADLIIGDTTPALVPGSKPLMGVRTIQAELYPGKVTASLVEP